MIIQGYSLTSEEKFDRALNGTLLSDSTRKGGVGNGAYHEDGVWKRNNVELTEEEVSKLEFALLAEYDRFAGTIRRGNDQVKLGSFWNFKGRKPHEKPHVVFVYRFGHKVVEVADGVELPGEVKAQKVLEQVQEEEKKVKRVKKAKREEE